MTVTIETVTPRTLGDLLPALAQVLHACVSQGASVGFVAPFTAADSEAWWRRRIAPALEEGGLVLLAARQGGEVVGTVQLDCDTPANQPHRAEVRKLLVHPRARRAGVARQLMVAIEASARERGRTLLTLDTRSGDHAEPLYLGMGYVVAGRIPGYARASDADRLDATTIMYKELPA
ncbi:GNAT family N-acetyltransferase [Bordetella genomosp. 5]|uniref:GNAT family N-acetyltransferase n=1 Tax=Bordetella genomosp. 5 TaxID=1395608 RepID=UPI000B9E9B68|nr:GNAT family N-acetyltransferase [Bordetella genomosp. 5]OZI46064.1 GNAT family N-acetyltransferase [Bordetella genomosp. 5]